MWYQLTRSRFVLRLKAIAEHFYLSCLFFWNNNHHITCWIRYFPRRRSWPDFVWSLSLLFLAISFDHMHPLSPVHFSPSHSLPAFSTFVSVFLYYHSLQISKPKLSRIVKKIGILLRSNLK